jgi:predicted ribosome quality control (RQC) complex YloA/Tae2 family protein
VSIQDIEDLEAEWRARKPAGTGSRPLKRSSARKRTAPVLDVKGHAIYVGKSGSENDRVTFDLAGPDDTWLHARGVPGSHVIVRWNSPVRDDDAVLLRAAELAAFYSQSRSSGRVEVDITPRRFVRKIKGAGPGMVTYRNERTVSVAPVGPG